MAGGWGFTRARIEDGEGHVLAPRGGGLRVLEGKALVDGKARPGRSRPVFSPPPLLAPPKELADPLRLMPGQVDRVLAAGLDERVVDTQAVLQPLCGLRPFKLLRRQDT